MRTANRLSAVMSHTSAAAHWGWEMKDVPARATVTVPRNRKVSAEVRADVDVFWRPMARGRVGSALVTSPVQTVLDCARWLSFDAALAVADSALRHRSVTRAELVKTHDSFRGHSRQHVLRVIEAADARAANPFESVLRAIRAGCARSAARTSGRGPDAGAPVGEAGSGRRAAEDRCGGRQLRASRFAKGTCAGLCPVRQPRRRRLDGVALCLGARDAPSGLGAFDPRGRHRSSDRRGRVTSTLTVKRALAAD